MTMHLRSSSAAALALGLAISTPRTGVAASKDPASKTSPKNLQALRVVPEVPIPQSVFVIPSQPSEGRNPFFPQSFVRVVPVKVNPGSPIDTSSFFVLNGITSPPRRTAMINGRTFEPGEEGEVRLASGAKMLIKCVEIKADSAIIDFSGQRRELRMRSGL